MRNRCRPWLVALLVLSATPVTLASSIAQTEAARAAYADGRTEVAAALFERAARAGNRVAQYRYAMMLQQGEIVARDANTAWRWLRRASYAGLPEAQYEFGRLYETGEIVTQSLATASQWYGRAARQGHPDAQVRLAALLLDDQAGPADPEAAWRWLLAAARAGHRGALDDLVRLYRSGRGAEREN
jgi:TPR repeat protein